MGKVDFKGLLDRAYQSKQTILTELMRVQKKDNKYVILAKGDIFLPLSENAEGFYYNGHDLTPQYYTKEYAERITAGKIKLMLPTFTELPNGMHKRNIELIDGKPMLAYDYLTCHLKLMEDCIKIYKEQIKAED